MEKEKKGFTLIELIVVIAILLALLLMLVPTFGGIMDYVKESMDKMNLSTLNRITTIYDTKYPNDKTDIFDGINTDENRQKELIDKDVMDKMAVPMVEGVEFVWDIPTQKWLMKGSDGGEKPKGDGTIMDDLIKDDITIRDEFTAGEAYNYGDIVLVDGVYYKFCGDIWNGKSSLGIQIAYGPTDETNDSLFRTYMWKKLDLNFQPNYYEKGDIVMNEGKYYIYEPPTYDDRNIQKVEYFAAYKFKEVQKDAEGNWVKK